MPGGHAFELERDGSIWCGDLLLAHAGGGGDRLLGYHIEEIARCTRVAGLDALPAGRLDIVLRDPASFSRLQRVLGLGGRKAIALAHYRLVRMQGAGVAERSRRAWTTPCR